MYGLCFGACMHGIDGRTVSVEVDLSNGLPAFSIVGLPDSAVREAAERVRAALKNGSYEFPMRRITVNLAPADVRKEGASFDLAIAVGILITSGQWPSSVAEETMFLGELSLKGDVRPVHGVLSMAMAAKDAGLKRIVVPLDNAREAALVEGIEVVPVSRLSDALNTIGEVGGSAAAAAHSEPASAVDELDFADVVGQAQAKRALAVAAAGLHNVLFIGPPGSGKTMLMRRLATILPPLEDEEALEVTKIHSAAGYAVKRGGLIRRRPFRAPHHTISTQGLIGGGAIPRPGEVSLAHRGVLFLDELPEFPRAALESLRQPMEDGTVTIARARSTFTFPARFILAATMNPCPCGYDGYEDEFHSCSCTAPRKLGYLSRLSGPLLDRIDIVLDIPRVSPEEASMIAQAAVPSAASSGSSEAFIPLIREARQAQLERFRGSRFKYNSELSGTHLHRYCRIDPEASRILMRAYRELGLSARGQDRVLKVARTIADLEGADHITAGHMNEALLYRSLDMRKQRWSAGEHADAALQRPRTRRS